MGIAYNLDLRTPQDLPDQFAWRNTDPIRRFIESSLLNNSGTGLYPNDLYPSLFYPIRMTDGSVSFIAEPVDSAYSAPHPSVGAGDDYSPISFEHILRWTDAANFYSSQICSLSTDTGDAKDNGTIRFSIWKRTAGVDTQIAFTDEPTDDWADLWTKPLRFEAVGNVINLYVDNVLKVTVTDTDHPNAGIYGLFGNWGMGNMFACNSVQWYDGAGVLIKDINFELRPTRAVLYGVTGNMQLDAVKGLRPSGSDRAMILVNEIDGPITLECDVYLDGTGTSFGLGISWKWNGDYYITFWSAGVFYIDRYDAATNTYPVLASTALALGVGAHHISFSRDGSSLSATIDATTITATNSVIPDGGHNGIVFGGGTDVSFSTVKLTGQADTVTGNAAVISTADDGADHHAMILLTAISANVVRYEIYQAGSLVGWQDLRIWARSWVTSRSFQVSAYPTSFSILLYDKYGNYEQLDLTANSPSAPSPRIHPGVNASLTVNQ